MIIISNRDCSCPMSSRLITIRGRRGRDLMIVESWRGVLDTGLCDKVCQ